MQHFLVKSVHGLVITTTILNNPSILHKLQNPKTQLAVHNHKELKFESNPILISPSQSLNTTKIRKYDKTSSKNWNTNALTWTVPKHNTNNNNQTFPFLPAYFPSFSQYPNKRRKEKWDTHTQGLRIDLGAATRRLSRERQSGRGFGRDSHSNKENDESSKHRH